MAIERRIEVGRFDTSLSGGIIISKVFSDRGECLEIKRFSYFGQKIVYRKNPIYIPIKAYEKFIEVLPEPEELKNLK
jgi:hypothetical protein